MQSHESEESRTVCVQWNRPTAIDSVETICVCVSAGLFADDLIDQLSP